MSYLQYLTAKTFSKYHPDYEIRLFVPTKSSEHVLTPYTKEEVKYEEYTGKDYFDKLFTIPNLKLYNFDFDLIDIDFSYPEVHKSDFIRWYLIYTYGGIWSDFDILYINSIEKVINYNRNEYFGDRTNIDTGVIYNHIIGDYPIGFLFGSKDNAFFKKLHSESYKHFDKCQYQSVGSDLLRRLYFKPRNIYECEKLNIIDMDLSTIYPVYQIQSKEDLPFFNNEIKIDSRITAGIHWFNGHNYAKEFCNNFNSNIRELKTSFIKHVLNEMDENF